MKSQPSPAGRGARLVSNSRWNLLSFGLSLLVNLITIPMAIGLIGLAAFGGAGLVLAAYAPFMFVGTVLSQALIKDLAPVFANRTVTGTSARSLLSAGLTLSVMACTVVVLGLTLAADQFTKLLPADGQALAVGWRECFLVAGLGWVAQQMALVLQGCMAATQHYGTLALANGFIALASAGLVLAACAWQPNALGFLAGTSAGFLLGLAVWLWLLARQVAGLFPLTRPSGTDIKTLARFGQIQGFAHFLGAIGNQADRYMLGAIAPLAVLGQFNVAMRLQEVVHMGLLKITEVLLPHFAVTASDPITRRADFFLRANWMINLLGASALAPLIPLADSLITLWVGANAAELGAPILRTLAMAGIAGCGINLYYYFALGTGQQAKLAALTTAHALMTVLFTVIALTFWGPLAAGAGYLLANIIRLLLGMWLTRLHFEGSLRLLELMGSVAAPLLTAGTVGMVAFASDWLHPNNWVALIASYVLLGLAALLGATAVSALFRSGRFALRSSAAVLRGGIEARK